MIPRISFLKISYIVTTVISFLSIVITLAVKRLLIVLLLHRYLTKLKLFPAFSKKLELKLKLKYS